MHCLLFCLVYFFVYTKSDRIDLKIKKHFSSDLHKNFERIWKNHKSSIESSLSSVLEEMNAIKGLNVYTKDSKNLNLLTKGFLLKDNVVELLVLDMYIRELPLFKKPNVTYTLTSKVISLETNLEKIIMDSFYVLFRNDSVLLKPGTEQDPYKYSPFSFQQVESNGNLSIVAEDCSLNGIFLTIINDNSVSFGDYTVSIDGCKFYVEILSPGSGSPPIIAPYFTDFQKSQLQNVIASRICQDMIPKMEGAVINYINPRHIFGPKAIQYCKQEKDIVASTRDWLNRFIKNVNKLIIKETRGELKLTDYEINWNETVDKINYERIKLSLKNMTIYGLDTAYSANKGGPFRLNGFKIRDTIKFSLVQIRGTLSHQFKGVTKQNHFTFEPKDFSTKIELNLPKMSRKTVNMTVAKFETEIPRNTEFSIVGAENFLMSYGLINGYITDLLPEAIQYIFVPVLNEAISATLKDKDIDLVSFLAKQGLHNKVKMFYTGIVGHDLENVFVNNVRGAANFRTGKKRSKSSDSSSNSSSASDSSSSSSDHRGKSKKWKRRKKAKNRGGCGGYCGGGGGRGAQTFIRADKGRNIFVNNIGRSL